MGDRVAGPSARDASRPAVMRSRAGCPKPQGRLPEPVMPQTASHRIGGEQRAEPVRIPGVGQVPMRGEQFGDRRGSSKPGARRILL
ncbi:hypothetical protein AQJ43_10340 [Streptomyces avermitilis]|nr:hypothetical protein AQJ43_10340 [Streptomyces avermitilis]